MFFILSKTLSYFTMPFLLICMCFILSAVLRNVRWKKRFFRAALIMLFFFSNDFIANEVMLAWEPDATPYKDMKKQYAFGIVLTGVTSLENTPRDRVYFNQGADRVTHAVQLYKLGIVKKLLVSGGSGRLVDIGEKEAVDIKKAMLLMGVPDAEIIIESDSRNTHESALEVKKIIAAQNITPGECLLITSAFHMRRSIACYRMVDMDMDTFTTDFYTHPRKFTPDVLIIPRVESIALWHKLIREWVGMAAYKIAGYV